jgi:seryl-tRNA(Sec) selenium transferase
MLSQEQVRALGQILDTTFGRSSTTESATASFKTKLQGEMLTVTYATIRKFASEHDQFEQTKDFDKESAQLTNDFMKDTKKDFKASAGSALKVKEQSSMTDFEVIGIQAHVSPARTVYCKRITTFEITN